jgi:iron complex transport system permease protein
VLVAQTGAIGFVGLVVPHSVRSLIGVRHRRLVPVSFVAGAVIMIWADLLSRVIVRPSELPVGVLTALCGAPLFLYLLRRRDYRFG